MELCWIVIAFSVGCAWMYPKPKPCQACSPSRVVEVRKPCMEPLPELPRVHLPTPDAAGVMHLDEETYRGLYELLAKVHQYLATQLERCGEVPASQPR